MMFEVFFMAAVLGQCEYEELGHYADPMVVYKPTVEYWYGNWSRETEFQGRAMYGGVWKTVPIINGFAPEIKKSRFKTVYNYRKRIPYNKCVKPKKIIPSGEKIISPPSGQIMPLVPSKLNYPATTYRDKGLLRPSDVN